MALPPFYDTAAAVAGGVGNIFDDPKADYTLDEMVAAAFNLVGYLKNIDRTATDKITVPDVIVPESKSANARETIDELKSYSASRVAINEIVEYLRSKNLVATFKIITGFDRADAALGRSEMGFPPLRVDAAGNPDHTALGLINILDPTAPAVTERQIRQSNRAFAYWINHSYIKRSKNLSEEVILNACTEQLKQEILDRLKVIPIAERGGALTYHFLMERLQISNVESSIAVWKRLVSINIASVDGQDLNEVTNLVRTTKLRLAEAGYAPAQHDERFEIKKLFTTCTAPRFVSWLHTTCDTNPAFFDNTENALRDIAAAYEKFVTGGEWLPLKPGRGRGYLTPQDDFAAKMHELNLRELALKKQKLEYEEKQLEDLKKNADQKPPTKPGLGSFGKNKKDAQGRWIYSLSGAVIDYEPPKPGQPTCRTNPKTGRAEMWCPLCPNPRWGNHDETGHDAFVERGRKLKAEKEAKEQAKEAVEETTPQETTGSANFNAFGTAHLSPSPHDSEAEEEGENPFTGASL
jgi:hypothetical protein